MKSYLRDITSDFKKANGEYRLDVSLWKNLTIQVVNPSGTFDFKGSNDGNAILNAGPGNAYSAMNFTPIQAVNLATGATVTAAAGAGLYKIEVFCKYIQIGGAGADADKVIIFENSPE